MSSAWHASFGATAQFQIQNCRRRYACCADLTSQANHLGLTIQADIIKQKLPERSSGYGSVEKAFGSSYGKTSKIVNEKLLTDNPIDMVRYQVANCYRAAAVC